MNNAWLPCAAYKENPQNRTQLEQGSRQTTRTLREAAKSTCTTQGHASHRVVELGRGVSGVDDLALCLAEPLQCFPGVVHRTLDDGEVIIIHLMCAMGLVCISTIREAMRWGAQTRERHEGGGGRGEWKVMIRVTPGQRSEMVLSTIAYVALMAVVCFSDASTCVICWNPFKDAPCNRHQNALAKHGSTGQFLVRIELRARIIGPFCHRYPPASMFSVS